LTHAELLELISDWKRESRMKSKKFGSIEPSQVLAVASAGDIDRLVDARAAIYSRLSDECLYEVATLNKIIRRLGRSRYRRDVGLTEKVVAP